MLKPSFFSVDLELTNLCENKCLMCPRDAIKRTRGLMDEETFTQIISILKKRKPLVTLSGMGDPLRHPLCLEYVRRLREEMIPAGLVVHPLSLLKSGIMEGLKKARPNQVLVSFPSSRKDMFESLCPDISFNTALEAVKTLLRLSKGKFGVRVSGLMTQINSDEKKEYVRFWQDLGVHAWIRTCHGRGGNLKDSSIYRRKKSGPDNSPCSLFLFHSFITWEGEVLACCHDLTGETRLCNIRDGADEIISNKQKILSKSPLFDLCKVCDEPLRNVKISALSSDEKISRRRFFKGIKT